MTALLPWERLGGKIADWHLERVAVVYVRQSPASRSLIMASRPGYSMGWWSGRSGWGGRPRGCW